MSLTNYLNYSIHNKIMLTLKTKNEKDMNIFVTHFNNEKVYFSFINGKEGQIKIENIKEYHCKDDSDEKEFKYHMISKKYYQKNIKEIISNFKSYYMEILNLLQQKETIDSFEYKYYDFKKDMYQQIFSNLYKDQENLLFSYFTGYMQGKKEKSLEEILLLQQSNLSQKKAIKSALSNKISIIEGPPRNRKDYYYY